MCASESPHPISDWPGTQKWLADMDQRGMVYVSKSLCFCDQFATLSTFLTAFFLRFPVPSLKGPNSLLHSRNATVADCEDCSHSDFPGIAACGILIPLHTKFRPQCRPSFWRRQYARLGSSALHMLLPQFHPLHPSIRYWSASTSSLT